jgi:hypothetical protein
MTRPGACQRVFLWIGAPRVLELNELHTIFSLPIICRMPPHKREEGRAITIDQVFECCLITDMLRSSCTYFSRYESVLQ